MTPTSPANLALIEEFHKKAANLMMQLYSRWQDEQEYEDIESYKEPISKLLPDGWIILKMNKRPFGFDFNIGMGTDAVYNIFMNQIKYGWKRIK